MLAAHCYPTAGYTDLCLLADWMTWLFILDDHNDEGSYGWDPESLERALTKLFFAVDPAGSEGPKNPIGAALSDIVERLDERMPPEWRHRFLHHLIDYFTAYVWQAAHRRGSETPDLDVFSQMRRDAGAIMPSFDLIEYAESVVLPASLYYSRTYQRLLVTAANVVCWTNDLMTLDKELANGDEQNLVAVIRQAGNIPLGQAIRNVAARTGQQVERFLAAEAELPRVFDRLRVTDELRTRTVTCVAMLRAWMRGHVDWGRTTARYLESDPSYGRAKRLDDLLTEIPIIAKEA